MKNKQLLDSFVNYCVSNPEQRFWQALRNWWREQVPSVGYILWADELDIITGRFNNVVDSFYSEDKLIRDEKDKYY